METTLELSFVVYPKDLNPAHSTLWGGKILSEMDTCAGSLANRVCYGTDCSGVVTKYMGCVTFQHATHLGDIVKIRSEVVKLGKTSVHIAVTVDKEVSKGADQGRSFRVCENTFVMVAIKDGRPHPHGKKL